MQPYTLHQPGKFGSRTVYATSALHAVAQLVKLGYGAASAANGWRLAKGYAYQQPHYPRNLVVVV